MLGHESCNLIKYLEGFEGVAPIKRGHNPATWMLEVTGGATSTGVKASKTDFPAAYKVTLPLLLFCPCLLSRMSVLSASDPMLLISSSAVVAAGSRGMHAPASVSMYCGMVCQVLPKGWVLG